MPGAELRLDGAVVRRGGAVVLRVPSLVVAAGEALAVVGPNGAGKSTLLALLAGLEPPARGRALIGGAPACALAARRRVALLPQDAPMLSGTVAENVARPLALRGVGGAERRRRTDVLLERLGLRHLADRRAGRLSGGEARRVALARALVTEPEALLLDEPFGGVDDPTRDRLVAELAAFARDGRTIVLVTQHRDEALRLAGRLAIAWGGALRQDGPIEQVLARPADAEIARFLGLANVLHGRVTGAGGATIDVRGVELRAAPTRPIATGVAVWVVFAPEWVELRAAADPGGGSPRNVLPARVASVTPREGRVEVALDAGFPLTAVVTRAAAEELGLAPGADVRAVIKATALHLIAA